MTKDLSNDKTYPLEEDGIIVESDNGLGIFTFYLYRGMLHRRDGPAADHEEYKWYILYEQDTKFHSYNDELYSKRDILSISSIRLHCTNTHTTASNSTVPTHTPWYLTPLYQHTH